LRHVDDSISNLSLEVWFEALEQQYGRSGYNLAYRLCGSYDDAQELCAEARLRAWMAFPKFRFDSSYATWRNRIIRNLFLDGDRHNGSHPECSLDEILATDRAVDVRVEDPFVISANRLTRAVVAEAVGRMPAIYRSVIILNVYAECSSEEVGQILRIPTRTVQTRLHRGRRMLRDRLASEICFEE